MKKKVFFLFVFLVLFLTKCNTNKTNLFDTENKNIHIGNKKNNHLISLPKLNYKNGKANYVFNGFLLDIGKYQAYEKEYNEIYSVTELDQKELAIGITGLAFCLKRKTNLYFYFPLNRSLILNNDYFDKKIYNKPIGTKIKIYVSVYKRDSISDLKTIIIDSVKLR